MKEFIEKILSKNSQSSMRLSLLIGLGLIIAITICVLIIAFKYSVWGLDLNVIDKLRDFALVVIVPLILGKVVQKFAETKENKEEQK